MSFCHTEGGLPFISLANMDVVVPRPNVTVLASCCDLLPYVYIYDVLPVTFSECQSRWHVTVSTDYIKWTAFLVIVVARIPLRQSYLDYD